jgi:hypothetical protein
MEVGELSRLEVDANRCIDRLNRRTDLKLARYRIHSATQGRARSRGTRPSSAVSPFIPTIGFGATHPSLAQRSSPVDLGQQEWVGTTLIAAAARQMLAFSRLNVHYRQCASHFRFVRRASFTIQEARRLPCRQYAKWSRIRVEMDRSGTDCGITPFMCAMSRCLRFTRHTPQPHLRPPSAGGLAAARGFSSSRRTRGPESTRES